MTVIIALDVGDRRIGVAASDPTGLLASPVGAIIRTDLAATLDGISSVVRDRSATSILVGVPLGLQGEATKRSEDIRLLATRIPGRAKHFAGCFPNGDGCGSGRRTCRRVG